MIDIREMALTYVRETYGADPDFMGDAVADWIAGWEAGAKSGLSRAIALLDAGAGIAIIRELLANYEEI